MKETILLIEDEIELQQNLKEILEFHGFTVVTADHGEDGFQKLEANPIDLIISDIMMPIMDGYQFLESIKLLEPFRHIPFIFLSAKASKEDRLKGMAYGADDYLAKPVPSRMLLNSIFVALDKKKEIVGLKASKNETKIIKDQSSSTLTPLSTIIEHLELQKQAVEKSNWVDVAANNEFALFRVKWLNASIQKIGYFLNHKSEVPTMANVFLGDLVKGIIRNLGEDKFFYQEKSEQPVVFDPQHIRLVLEELFENALKFVDPEWTVLVIWDGIELLISNRQNQFKSSEKIVVQPFCNLHCDAGDSGGLGLGLFLAREFCLKNNSRLDLSVDSDQVFVVKIGFNTQN
jgi:CheY-like chemotaxis protein